MHKHFVKVTMSLLFHLRLHFYM